MREVWDKKKHKKMVDICNYFKYENFKNKGNVILAYDGNVGIKIAKDIVDGWDRVDRFEEYLYNEYLFANISCFISTRKIDLNRIITYNFVIPNFD